MKKLHVNEIMKTLTGTPILSQTDSGEDSKPLTLKEVCVNALLHPRNDTEKTTGTEKFRRFQLAMKIHDADDAVSLPENDIELLKALIGAVYTTLIVGQVYQALEDLQKA